jgi:hypothetical protein
MKLIEFSNLIYFSESHILLDFAGVYTHPVCCGRHPSPEGIL